MAKRTDSRKNRHSALQEKLKTNPFMTDSELAEYLSVSISTVRLDRLTLGIPEVRERVLSVAEISAGNEVNLHETTDEVLDVEIGVRGILSVMTRKDMCIDDTDIVSAKSIFGISEKLARAITNTEEMMISFANIKYISPVPSGVRIIARGEIKQARDSSYVVSIRVYFNRNEVFRGKYSLTLQAFNQL